MFRPVQLRPLRRVSRLWLRATWAMQLAKTPIARQTSLQCGHNADASSSVRDATKKHQMASENATTTAKGREIGITTMTMVLMKRTLADEVPTTTPMNAVAVLMSKVKMQRQGNMTVTMCMKTCAVLARGGIMTTNNRM